MEEPCVGSRQASVKSHMLILRLAHAGCNLRLVKALAQGLPILYNHVVKEVKYDQAGVQVTAGNTVIAGAALTTEVATVLYTGMGSCPFDILSFCSSVQLSDLFLPASSAYCSYVPPATASSFDVLICSSATSGASVLATHCL